MGVETALQAASAALDGSLVVTASLVVAAAAVALGALAWRERGTRGAVPLAVLLGGVAVWTGADALSVLAPGRTWTVAWHQVTQVGVVTVLTAWALFVLEYAGFEDLLGARTYAALAAEPLLVVVLVFTNGSHGLFWPAYRFDVVLPGEVVPVLGPAFWVHVAYGYGVVLVSWGVLFATLVRRREALYRGQTLALAGGMVAPVLANAVWLAVRYPDPTPFGFLVSGGLLSVAVFRYRLANVTSVARDAVVERMRAAVVVLDGGDRVVDLNDAAERLLGLSADAVGRPAAEAFAAAPAVAEWYRAGADRDAEIDLDSAGERRTVSAEVTPLAEAGAGDARLFMFHDVTERKRRRESLSEQNDQLERFAAVAAHEFRNPLAIARGTVETAIDDPGAADLRTARRALDRIDRIVDEVLDIAREGRAVVDTEPVTLVSAAENAWADVETRRVSLGAVPATLVVADRVRLQRLLANLFRNCVGRATDPPEALDADGTATVATADDADADAEDGSGDVTGGAAPADAADASARGTAPDRPGRGTEEAPDGVTVRVGLLTAAPDGGTVPDGDGRPTGFYVADDGVAIPPADRQRVFETGYSGEYADLGLSVARIIAHAHGWDLRIAASRDGGTRFEVGGVEFVDGRGGPPP